jgi:filamentous hemagglutinin
VRESHQWVLDAGGDIAIEAGRETAQSEFQATGSSNGLLTRTTTNETRRSESDLAIGSELKAGGLAYVAAGGNLVAEGVKISGDEGVLVHAAGVLDIREARESRSESLEVSVKKSGMAGSFGGRPLPTSAAERTALGTQSDTASVSSITSERGGVLLEGERLLRLQGVQVDAAKDVSLRGGSVDIAAATESTQVTTEHFTKGTKIGATLWHDLGDGIGARNTDTVEVASTALARTTLSGANVSIEATGEDGEGGQGGDLRLAGTRIDTPGTLTLEADKLHLDTQMTQADTRRTTQ